MTYGSDEGPETLEYHVYIGDCARTKQANVGPMLESPRFAIAPLDTGKTVLN